MKGVIIMPRVPLVAVKNLVYLGNNSQGNHWAENRKYGDEEVREYYYHSTMIAAHNRTRQEWWADNRGYGSVSTNWSVRSYERTLSGRRVSYEAAKEYWGTDKPTPYEEKDGD